MLRCFKLNGNVAKKTQNKLYHYGFILSTTHLSSFVSDDTQRNPIKPKVIMNKALIAIGTSLGFLLITVIIVMIIYYWKYRGIQRGICKTLFVVIFLK